MIVAQRFAVSQSHVIERRYAKLARDAGRTALKKTTKHSVGSGPLGPCAPWPAYHAAGVKSVEDFYPRVVE